MGIDGEDARAAGDVPHVVDTEIVGLVDGRERIVVAELGVIEEGALEVQQMLLNLVRLKYRETPLGTTLYFSSEEEIEQIYSPQFRILELDSKEVTGKFGPQLAVVALLERE